MKFTMTHAIVLLLLLLGKLYQLVLHIVAHRSANNPTPDNVADIFDKDTYETWKRYSAEKCRLQMVSTCVSFAVTAVLLCSGAYVAAAGLFPDSDMLQMLAVLVVDTLVSFLFSFGINYVNTMVIEQKYGFNRSTLKTFLIDQLRGSLLLELGFSLFLASLLMWLHQSMGDWLIVLFAGALFLLMLFISFLYPLLSRIGNKFVPLEEGELRDKLMALLNKHGYQVKAIEVMDASRRTTKLNAYFTGFGKLKTIVLYDNLVNAMTPDEICAVFAHELGHGLHKDVLKRQIMNFGNMLIMATMVWLAVRYPQLYLELGFDGINYGFATILLNIGLGLLQPLVSMVMNAYSRFAEYRADRQAVAEGYGQALITGLKKMAKENFVHLAPSKVNVILEYSHPPLSQRIEAVERAMEK